MKKLAVANGSYVKDGEQKTRWVNVGVIGTTQEGKEYMLIDPTINFAAFPRQEGKDMVMVGIFEDQNNQQQNNNQGQNNQPQVNYQDNQGQNVNQNQYNQNNQQGYNR